MLPVIHLDEPPLIQTEIGQVINVQTGTTSLFFDGMIDDIRIYNKILTQGDLDILQFP